MNTLKNMEAIFLVTLAVAGPATLAVDAIPEANASPVTASATARTTTMPVVVISAKRMSAAEKQQSLEEEARLAGVRVAAGSRI